jgi:TonB family protein
MKTISSVVGIACFIGLIAMAQEQPKPEQTVAVEPPSVEAPPNVDIKTMKHITIRPPKAKYMCDPILRKLEKGENRAACKVVLEVVVERDGRISEAKAKGTSECGQDYIDAAIAAVMKWYFEPAKGDDGNTYRVYHDVKFDFKKRHG